MGCWLAYVLGIPDKIRVLPSFPGRMLSESELAPRPLELMLLPEGFLVFHTPPPHIQPLTSLAFIDIYYLFVCAPSTPGNISYNSKRRGKRGKARGIRCEFRSSDVLCCLELQFLVYLFTIQYFALQIKS